MNTTTTSADSSMPRPSISSGASDQRSDAAMRQVAERTRVPIATGERLVDRAVHLLRDGGCEPVVVVLGVAHAAGLSAVGGLLLHLLLQDRTYQNGPTSH